MTKEEFEKIVKDAFDDLPKYFRKKLENIEIVVEDMPIGQKSLLGLYQGVPLKHRGVWYGNVMPDKITIFKQNIERLCRNEEEIRTLVTDVLIHEIGHYFGFDDDELQRIRK
jgi:predicted Zn-dependent protease with MMP-like domain